MRIIFSPKYFFNLLYLDVNSGRDAPRNFVSHAKTCIYNKSY